MTVTVGFDVYGTLIDTQGLVLDLEGLVGDVAKNFSQLWRDKQLEYSFRRGLMQDYANFGVCTRQALDYTCKYYGSALTDAQKKSLLLAYSQLPAFQDAQMGLASLQGLGYRLFAFSNGAETAVRALLDNSGLAQFFEGVVSCDDLVTFKPNPEVYRYFLRKAGAGADSVCLVSSNPFDVIGAETAGLKSVWVQRSPEAVFDPWGVEPSATINDLACLGEALQGNNGLFLGP